MKSLIELCTSLKKVLLSVGLFFFVSVCVANVQNVGTEINLQVSIIDPTEDYEPYQKGPIEIPSVSLENYTLFFATPCDGFTLRLLDEESAVVYSIVIPIGTTSLVLPSYLFGDYEINLVTGNWLFSGWINL